MFYMLNTMGDVAMTLCSIQSKISLPFLSLGHVLRIFLNFGLFSILTF